MNEEVKASYIIATAPVVEKMLEGYLTYNQATSYIFWLSFIIFVYFTFSPQTSIKKIRSALDNRLKKRKSLGYLWLGVLIILFISISTKPVHPMRYDEMPEFQGTYAWFQTGGKSRISSIYLRKNDRKFIFKFHHLSSEITEQIKNLNKGDIVSLRIHLEKDDFQVKPYVTEININGVKSYLLKSTYQERFERYKDRNKYILFWLICIVIISFYIFRKLPKTNKTTE
ncbi:hypothetical protein [Endozoicomonas sp. ALD040]|uniref:hypothetical protein n=1 Tax=unclassified Endozoicomonas TaxID=2644528 RepID=UPI003BAEB5CA